MERKKVEGEKKKIMYDKQTRVRRWGEVEGGLTQNGIAELSI